MARTEPRRPYRVVVTYTNGQPARTLRGRYTSLDSAIDVARRLRDQEPVGAAEVWKSLPSGFLDRVWPRNSAFPVPESKPKKRVAPATSSGKKRPVPAMSQREREMMKRIQELESRLDLVEETRPDRATVAHALFESLNEYENVAWIGAPVQEKGPMGGNPMVIKLAWTDDAGNNPRGILVAVYDDNVVDQKVRSVAPAAFPRRDRRGTERPFGS